MILILCNKKLHVVIQVSKSLWVDILLHIFYLEAEIKLIPSYVVRSEVCGQISLAKTCLQRVFLVENTPALL